MLRLHSWQRQAAKNFCSLQILNNSKLAFVGLYVREREFNEATANQQAAMGAAPLFTFLVMGRVARVISLDALAVDAES